MRRVRLGLLGCGTVGAGVVRLIARERERIRARYGLDIEIDRILVRDTGRRRDGVDPGLITGAALEVVDGDCNVVVELIGGTHTAAALVRRALESGRHVVTANKALLAESGGELARSAGRFGVGLGIEASVCGGIPVIRTLQHGLAGDRIDSLSGILNGTANYVLTRMQEGSTLAEGLRSAQDRGFAEADPSLDLSGADALQKLTVLARLAFDEPIRRSEASGIEGVTRAQIEGARKSGRVLRQVAEASRVAGGIALSVKLTAVDAGHPFATIRDEQNAVLIGARAAGEILLCGKGAGSLPTAAAVLSDIIAVGGGPAARAAA